MLVRMSHAAPSKSFLQDVAAGHVTVIGLTTKQYHHLIGNNLLDEDTETELLDGLMVRKDRSAHGEDPVTIGDRHRIAVQRLVRLARDFDPLGGHLQIQQPIVCPPHHEPEPDASVARGLEGDYTDRPPGPGDVLSVIEVADRSLARDLSTKLRIYAEAAIPQYVVVDLVHNVVLVHSQPAAGSYAAPIVLRSGDALRISGGNGRYVEIAVQQLLP